MAWRYLEYPGVMQEELVRHIVKEVLERLQGSAPAPGPPASAVSATPSGIPVNASNRHVHISRLDLEALFGAGYALTKLRDLLQPGQFAANETLTLVGPAGVKEKVRILGPVRQATQVELCLTDCYVLGLSRPPVRDSGDIGGTPGVVLVGPKGAVSLSQGVILSQRHIHMTPQDARSLGVQDKQKVKVRIEGERGVIFENVLVRVREDFALEMHLDIDEANACSLLPGAKGYLV